MAKRTKADRKRAKTGVPNVEQAVLPLAPRNARRANDDPATWGPSDRLPSVTRPALSTLLARGTIERELYDAGREIEHVFHAVTAGLMAKAADPNRSGRGTGEMSDPMLEAYVDRYRPWADRLSGAHAEVPDAREMVRVLHSVPVDDDMAKWANNAAARQQPRAGKSYHQKTLAFCIAVAVDGRSIDDVARDEGHDHRTVRRALIAGLTLYADLAGWTRRAA